jgi:hypothetical protein
MRKEMNKNRKPPTDNVIAGPPIARRHDKPLKPEDWDSLLMAFGFMWARSAAWRFSGLQSYFWSIWGDFEDQYWLALGGTGREPLHLRIVTEQLWGALAIGIERWQERARERQAKKAIRAFQDAAADLKLITTNWWNPVDEEAPDDFRDLDLEGGFQDLSDEEKDEVWRKLQHVKIMRPMLHALADHLKAGMNEMNWALDGTKVRVVERP